MLHTAQHCRIYATQMLDIQGQSLQFLQNGKKHATASSQWVVVTAGRNGRIGLQIMKEAMMKYVIFKGRLGAIRRLICFSLVLMFAFCHVSRLSHPPPTP